MNKDNIFTILQKLVKSLLADFIKNNEKDLNKFVEKSLKTYLDLDEKEASNQAFDIIKSEKFYQELFNKHKNKNALDYVNDKFSEVLSSQNLTNDDLEKILKSLNKLENEANLLQNSKNDYLLEENLDFDKFYETLEKEDDKEEQNSQNESKNAKDKIYENINSKKFQNLILSLISLLTKLSITSFSSITKDKNDKIDSKNLFKDLSISTIKTIIILAVKIASEKKLFRKMPKAIAIDVIACMVDLGVENSKILVSLANKKITKEEAVKEMSLLSTVSVSELVFSLSSSALGAISLSFIPVVGPIIGGFAGSMVGSMLGESLGKKVYFGAKKLVLSISKSLSPLVSTTKYFSIGLKEILKQDKKKN